MYDGPECESPTKRQLRHAYLAVPQHKFDSLIRTCRVYYPWNDGTVETVSAGIVYGVMLARFNHKNRFRMQRNTFHLFSVALLSILSTLVKEPKVTYIQYTILTTHYVHDVFKVRKHICTTREMCFGPIKLQHKRSIKPGIGLYKKLTLL